MKNPLVFKFLSKELLEFLGDFTVESAEYSISYILKCKDGRSFHAYSHAGLLNEIESAYNKYLKDNNGVGRVTNVA